LIPENIGSLKAPLTCFHARKCGKLSYAFLKRLYRKFN